MEVLVELRQALIVFQDYHILLLTRGAGRPRACAGRRRARARAAPRRATRRAAGWRERRRPGCRFGPVCLFVFVLGITTRYPCRLETGPLFVPGLPHGVAPFRRPPPRAHGASAMRHAGPRRRDAAAGVAAGGASAKKRAPSRATDNGGHLLTTGKRLFWRCEAHTLLSQNRPYRNDSADYVFSNSAAFRWRVVCAQSAPDTASVEPHGARAVLFFCVRARASVLADDGARGRGARVRSHWRRGRWQVDAPRERDRGGARRGRGPRLDASPRGAVFANAQALRPVDRPSCLAPAPPKFPVPPQARLGGRGAHNVVSTASCV